jgi:asparagine N-glycosylation enzyme membrane subunit Stt3
VGHGLRQDPQCVPVGLFNPAGRLKLIILLLAVPIIASVSEHQPTAWPSFFFDLQMMIFIFPAGIFLCFQKLSDGHVFVIIYALLASYFAGVMVRLVSSSGLSLSSGLG